MMKHIKLFEEFSNKKLVVYHNSGVPVNTLTDRPMWFSLTLDSGLGFYDNMMMDTGESYLYKAEFIGNFIEREKLAKLFDKNGVDFEDWEVEVVNNPDEEDLMELEGTKLIIENGYDGAMYFDYDPWDSDEDILTLIVFKPKSISKSFMPVKQAEKLLAQYKEKNDI